VLANLLDNALKYATPIPLIASSSASADSAITDTPTPGTPSADAPIGDYPAAPAARVAALEPALAAPAASAPTTTPDIAPAASGPGAAAASPLQWADTQRFRLRGRPCIAISCFWAEEDGGHVTAEVWSSFDRPLDAGELQRVFDWGYRGQAATGGGHGRGAAASRERGRADAQRGREPERRGRDGATAGAKPWRDTEPPADRPGSVAGGDGLGLPFAQQLIRRMGGQLQLINAPMPPWAWHRRAVLLGLPTGGDAPPGEAHRPGGVSAVLTLPRAGAAISRP
jgi:hypothetical protein